MLPFFLRPWCTFSVDDSVDKSIQGKKEVLPLSFRHVSCLRTLHPRTGPRGNRKDSIIFTLFFCRVRQPMSRLTVVIIYFTNFNTEKVCPYRTMRCFYLYNQDCMSLKYISSSFKGLSPLVKLSQEFIIQDLLYTFQCHILLLTETKVLNGSPSS